MSTIHLTSRVGPDGVLELSVPLDPSRANRAVRVTVDVEDERPRTREEWSAFLESVAGSIEDPSFRRHPEGAGIGAKTTAVEVPR